MSISTEHELATVDAPSAKESVFGSFVLANHEFVIDLKFVREVVRVPEDIRPMPLAPDYLLGIFSLRGEIIPLLDLSPLLLLGSSDMAHEEKKIAIIEQSGASIGILFDQTGEVVRPRDGEVNEFNYNNTSTSNVIKGALKLDGGSRLIQILDSEAIVSIKNLPQIQSFSKEKPGISTIKNSDNERKWCISFMLTGMRLAFSIGSIKEILPMQELQQSMIQNNSVMGKINLRGQIVPVIDFAALLNQPKDENQSIENSRIIVLEFDSYSVGLMVDAIESIDSFYKEDLVTVPIFNEASAAMFEGCYEIEDKDPTFLLRTQSIFSGKELETITQGFSSIYDKEASSEDSSKRPADFRSYVTFHLNQLFGLPIKRVQEIIPFSDDIISAPGTPDLVKGFLSLRGKMITVVETSQLLGIDQSENVKDSSKSKIIILPFDDDLIGLLVDGVESIVTVDHNKIAKVPDMISKNTGDSDVDEVVTLDTADKNVYLSILNADKIGLRVARMNSTSSNDSQHVVEAAVSSATDQ
ncbi:MAG: chemotaxis protein CheW [Granulosicoccus sp.]|nr:chemotaxis protein CheW [Granulosicoccus sp.]